MAGHTLKRWLYLTHRWIGIVSCLFFVMWFASGLVMLYVPYPSLDRDEWLAGQQPVQWDAVNTGPADLLLFADSSQLRSLSLEMRGDQPVWRRQGWDGEERLYSATDGELLGDADRAEAQRIAERFAGAPVAAIEQLHHDQWTVAPRYESHRPLWKAGIAGDAGREIYVSSRTGQVLLETDRPERFWNWLGSVPHWIYPTVIRQDGAVWRQVVMWLSGPCIIAAITGIWIGILRLRLGSRRFRGGRASPYRGWMWWHHIPGLFGSLFLVLWIFSGWLSVDPGNLFSSEPPGQEAQMRYAGQAATGSEQMRAAEMTRLAMIAPDARRIVWSAAAGRPHVQIEAPGVPDRHLDTGGLERLQMARTDILRGVQALFPGRPVAAMESLSQPDLYWYAVNADLPLPVWRVRLADPAATWLHIDPASGKVLGSLDRKGRIYRWLYTLFHRWDFNILLDHRPARDLLIWVFSIFGLITSVTGVWIGWLRLRPAGKGSATRKNGRRQSGKAAEHPATT